MLSVLCCSVGFLQNQHPKSSAYEEEQDFLLQQLLLPCCQSSSSLACSSSSRRHHHSIRCSAQEQQLQQPHQHHHRHHWCNQHLMQRQPTIHDARRAPAFSSGSSCSKQRQLLLQQLQLQQLQHGGRCPFPFLLQKEKG